MAPMAPAGGDEKDALLNQACELGTGQVVLLQTRNAGGGGPSGELGPPLVRCSGQGLWAGSTQQLQQQVAGKAGKQRERRGEDRVGIQDGSVWRSGSQGDSGLSAHAPSLQGPYMSFRFILCICVLTRTLFWTPQAPGTYVMPKHTFRQSSHTHKIKINYNLLELELRTL